MPGLRPVRLLQLPLRPGYGPGAVRRKTGMQPLHLVRLCHRKETNKRTARTVRSVMLVQEIYQKIVQK